MQSFDDLQKEYTGDGEKSCLTLTIPVDEQIKQYQIGMLEKNHLELLLPLVVQRVNDEWKLSYDITSKIPLSRVLERKSLQHHEFEFIIRQFAAMVHDLKEYLLDLPSVVFNKNFIFCDPAEFTLFFIYLPMRSFEKEPERIKGFLRKLIVEDIRLVEDISGTLLKKLLEALKSEAFTSELLYQCLDGTGMNQNHHMFADGNGQMSENTGGKEIIPGKASNPVADTHAKADKSSGKGRPDGSLSPEEQNGYPFQRSKREDLPASRVKNPQISHSNTPVNKANRQNTDSSLSALLKKYPKPSCFIAGGVNLLLLGILIVVIASAGKNPNNALGNIAGFLLIAAAGNYFLITRLFSKDKIIPTSEKSSVPAGNTTFKKRFINENFDEDIILPKNPAMRFREETNRGKIELPYVSQVSVSSSDWAIPSDSKAEKANNPEDCRNPGSGKTLGSRDLNQKTDESVSDQAFFCDSHIETETSKIYAQAACTQDDNQITAVSGDIGNNVFNSKASSVQNGIKSQTLESMIESVRPQVYSDKSKSAFQTPDEKRDRNQSFPDKTMVLGKPSQQLPCLISLIRPYEKIMLDKSPMFIGRLADSVDYIIQNRAVGKIHAEIKKIGERYFILDLNSVNGTYVNGERLICNTDTPMNNGDKITLANESYTFTA